MIDDDPGWGFSRRTLLMLIPYVGPGLRRRALRRNTDALVTLRQLFTAFCLSVIEFGIVLAVLRLVEARTSSSDRPCCGLLAAGALSALVEPRLERPLDCTDDAGLAGSYRTRFFLRLGLSEVAALFGFVTFFLTDLWWTYPVGATITGIGFARAAPTASHLRRDQEVLVFAGCPRSLVHALRGQLPGRG